MRIEGDEAVLWFTALFLGITVDTMFTVPAYYLGIAGEYNLLVRMLLDRGMWIEWTIVKAVLFGVLVIVWSNQENTIIRKGAMYLAVLSTVGVTSWNTFVVIVSSVS